MKNRSLVHWIIFISGVMMCISSCIYTILEDDKWFSRFALAAILLGISEVIKTLKRESK